MPWAHKYPSHRDLTLDPGTEDMGTYTSNNDFKNSIYISEPEKPRDPTGDMRRQVSCGAGRESGFSLCLLAVAPLIKKEKKGKGQEEKIK